MHRQLLFYFGASAKVSFMKRTLQVLLTTDTAAKLQGLKLWAYSQMNKAPLAIWYYGIAGDLKSVWLGREVLDIKVDCFLPRCQIKRMKTISFLSYFPLTMLLLIFIQWRSLWFFCPYSSLFWPEKIMPWFTYLRPLQRQIIQPPTDYWICYNAGDPLILSAYHRLLPDS